MNPLLAPSCSRSEIRDPNSGIALSPADAALLQLTLDASLNISTICERAAIPPSSFFAWIAQPHIHEVIERHLEFAERQANAKVQEALASALPDAIACLARSPAHHEATRRPANKVSGTPALQSDPLAFDEHFPVDYHKQLEQENMLRWLHSDDEEDDWDDDEDDFDDEGTNTKAGAILAALIAQYSAASSDHLTTEVDPAFSPHLTTDPARPTHSATSVANSNATSESHLTTEPSPTRPLPLVPHASTLNTHSFSVPSVSSVVNPDTPSEQHLTTEPSPTCPSTLTTDDLTSAWLTQSQIASLLHLTKQDISHHARQILRTGALAQPGRIHLTTAADGKRYRTRHYSPAMIFAIARRVKSPVAVLSARQLADWIASHPDLQSR